jgi:hypothetical protein
VDKSQRGVVLCVATKNEKQPSVCMAQNFLAKIFLAKIFRLFARL